MRTYKVLLVGVVGCLAANFAVGVCCAETGSFVQSCPNNSQFVSMFLKSGTTTASVNGLTFTGTFSPPSSSSQITSADVISATAFIKGSTLTCTYEVMYSDYAVIFPIHAIQNVSPSGSNWSGGPIDPSDPGQRSPSQCTDTTNNPEKCQVVGK